MSGSSIVPARNESRRDDDYPSLPLMLSLLDTAIDREQALGPLWDTGRLIDVRRAAEYVIFAVLEHKLRTIQGWHRQLFDRLFSLGWNDPQAANTEQGQLPILKELGIR